MSSNVWMELGALILLALLATGWLLAVRAWFRLRSAPAERLYATCADGWRVAVHFRPATVRRFSEPVVLCHGLAANHHNLDFEPPYSLAHFLNDLGYDTYAVDWRGTLHSSKPPRGKRSFDYSVDDHIELDGPAVLKLALEKSGAKQAFWIGHSLGGIVGYGVAGGASAALMRGLVTLGSPVFFKYKPLMKTAIQLGLFFGFPFRFRQRLFSLFTAPFVGHVALPLTDVILNPKHIAPEVQRKAYANIVSSISRKVLLQFRDWIWNDQLRSLDGKVDYRDRIRTLSVPVLIAAGSKDRLAPHKAINRAFELCGSKDKTLLVFGRDKGDKEEYGHGDLIFGTGAPSEVFPVLGRWLEERATRVDQARAATG